MNKRKLKSAARLAIAIHTIDFFGGGVDHHELGISEEDFDTLLKEADRVAQRLSAGNPLHFGSIKECIDHFRNTNP